MHLALLSPLAWVAFSGDIGSVLWCFVGVVVVFAIVFFILRQVGAPSFWFTVLYVIAAILALLLASEFFLRRACARRA
jgi:ABC-type glucose/galactose transport system permease subunit